MRRIYSILVLLLAGLQGYGQYILKKADLLYNQYKFADAIPLYERAYRQKISLHAAERLGDSYRLNNNYQQAEYWYGITVTLPGNRPQHRLYYAKALQSNGKFNEARQQYEAFAASDTTANAALVRAWITSCDSARTWMADSTNTQVTNMVAWNSSAADWGLSSRGGGPIWVSDRPNDLVDKGKRHFLKFDVADLPDRSRFPWTGLGYQRLYTSSPGDSAHFFAPFTAQDIDAVTYHIGPCSFSADGRQVYFAFTPVPENAPKKPKKTVVYTGLYFSELDSAGRWSKPAALPFNKPMYAATDPFISDDGRTLYFSANYPGGAGGMDLYAVNRRADGGWDTPQNLRAANTAGNERTPVAQSGQTLYFASDGHPGIGGLDIFRLRHDSVVNLGYPINSPQDDLNYTPSDSAGVAWFSSNRYNGLGADDIYRAYTPPPPPDDNYVYRSQVVDAQGNSIANARVVVKEAPLQTTSDANGDFLLPLKKQQKYEVQLLEQGRVAGLQQVNEDGSSTPAKLVKVEPNRRFRINIHYDYKDSTFRDEDRASLDELVAFLNTFPSVSIAVASHTDSRGDDAYNLRLSQQRAESIVTYLVSKGIDRARLNPVGYGETRLLNKCANGVTCTEEEHQQNRRAEFWVTKQ